MKTKHTLLLTCTVCVAALGLHTISAVADAAIPEGAIPWSQIGAKAGADYRGDGLAVTPTESGARLRCAFQRLEGEVMCEGLWLTSTITNTLTERFRVKAVEVGRTLRAPLPAAGTVTVEGAVVSFSRPGLVEECSVSIDGVRQDFVVVEKPVATGELAVALEVTGARVEAATYGAQLVLEQSGRKLAYSRLRVTDATGRELAARSAVEPPESGRNLPHSNTLRNTAHLVVLVSDAGAVYPVRIDPTFSDANWVSMGEVAGADGTVFAAAVDAWGNLYIGGDFNVVGDTVASKIAKWDGSGWSALGSGMNGTVYAIAVSGSDVYAAGNFTRTGTNIVKYVGKWDGSGWSALGSGLERAVFALAVSPSGVYAGGLFGTAGGTTANHIAIWDGNNWSALGEGVNGTVYAVAASGNIVYVGGEFTVATNSEGAAVTANYIARWDGSNWSAPGSGVNSTVEALAVSGTDVYAGGQFTMATNSGGEAVVADYIAKWDGTNWSALNVGMSSDVLALAVSGGDVYAAGRFGVAGTGPGYARYIAKWDGSSWSALGSGLGGTVYAMAVFPNGVYAGGSFIGAGGGAASRIAGWDGSHWSALASGTDNPVYALASSGSGLYAAGFFTMAGGTPAHCVARWDGSSWSALGSGLSDGVYSLALSGTNLYAGGQFTKAGGGSANYIARWNGTTWSALGSGMNVYGNVSALAVLGSDVYAGGHFTTAGGIPATNIARWDGSTWSAVGSGIRGASLYALAVRGGDLYAGGFFTAAGGGTANNIAKWDGTNWSALGSGVNNVVYALAISGSNLYAGGEFTTAGGLSASKIAKWDGSNWSAIGSGMNVAVNSLAIVGGDLYAGGTFSMAGGSAANRIAKWNGSSWSGLGSGMNGIVRALATWKTDLYAGGDFTTAGGKVSAYVARAIINPGSWLAIQAGVPGPNTNTLTYVGVPTNQYFVQFATNLTTSPWFPLTTNTAGADGYGIVQDPAATDGQRFYRVTGP